MELINFSLIQNRNLTEKQKYAYWRFRVLVYMMLGYASFYFVRQNLSFAIPGMEKSLGYSKIQLGNIASAFGLIYGFGKVINGIIGDRFSAKLFLALGLFLSAIVNIFMGLTSSLLLMTIFWSLNSCFQSMGSPSCAKLLAHWYGPKEIGTAWAVWSSSQQMGAALIGLGIAFFLPYLGWRYAFFIPGILCLITSVLVFTKLQDEPQNVGLTNLEKFEGLSTASIDECANMSAFQILYKQVLRNKNVWVMCIANFFLYLVRMGVFFWAPTFLCEAKGNTLEGAGAQTFFFNAAGILGSVLSGVLSDKLFEGKRGRAGLIFMVGLSLSVLALRFSPNGMPFIHTMIMLAIGFFVAGPQTLIGLAAVDFSSKRAAGSASGLTGTFGYLGATFAGTGIAWVAAQSGWNGVFMLMLASSVLGVLCFLFTWNTKPRAMENSNKDEKAKS